MVDALATREETEVLRDIASALADEISAAVHRKISLLDDMADKQFLCLSALTVTVGIAVGALKEDFSADDNIYDAAIDILRVMRDQNL